MKRLLILAAALAASAGLAQPPASPPATPDSHDPNEMVCQRVQMLGSRLNTGRMCMTRQQWERAAPGRPGGRRAGADQPDRAEIKAAGAGLHRAERVAIRGAPRGTGP